MSKVDERKRVKGEFLRARGAYLTAVSHVTQLHDAIAAAKATIKQAQDNQKGIETEFPVIGSNADERKATLMSYREGDPSWQQCAREIAEAEKVVRTSEPQIIANEYEIRIARYDMEIAIAEMRAIAGEDDERHTR